MTGHVSPDIPSDGTLSRPDGTLDTVAISKLTCDCIIGILPPERMTPQPLVVDIQLGCSLEDAATSGRLDRTVDYAELAQSMLFILDKGKFLLLESAAVALARWTLVVAPVVETVHITLTKPKALGSLAIPHVAVHRHRKFLECMPMVPGSVIFACPETTLTLADKKSAHGAGDSTQDFDSSSATATFFGKWVLKVTHLPLS